MMVTAQTTVEGLRHFFAAYLKMTNPADSGEHFEVITKNGSIRSYFITTGKHRVLAGLFDGSFICSAFCFIRQRTPRSYVENNSIRQKYPACSTVTCCIHEPFTMRRLPLTRSAPPNGMSSNS